VDKLAGLALVPSVTGSPRLAGVPGWLDCRVIRRMETGERTIYLADVVEGAIEREVAPLTRRQMLARAPVEKLQELKRQMQRDIEVDRAAMG
jgi:flavin reductase (DIM6/NTAB) family NADH-FMN oxidoreductase RutF